MAGYSETPLPKKLGMKPGSVVLVEGAPPSYSLPVDVTVATRVTGSVDLIHLFTKSAAEMEKKLRAWRERMRDDATVWVSWPKKSSKVPTDITEDVIRAIALPMGFVDVKVCAVDDTWSGLKLVIRKALRA